MEEIGWAHSHLPAAVQKKISRLLVPPEDDPTIPRVLSDYPQSQATLWGGFGCAPLEMGHLSQAC